MYKIRAAILTFFLATLVLQAQEGFYYQAVIKNPDGSPLKEAQVEVKISIVTNTTSLYTEQQSIVTSKEGFISFIIGNNNPATISNINWNQELFLEDQIDINDGQGFSTPSRIPLLKSPRSYISDRAISVLDNSITSASILDGSISNDDISATAEISFSKLSVSAPDIESLGFIQSDENFTTALKDKLDDIQDEANAYSLPTATSDVLGGVKVGTGITITDGVISADTQSDTNFTTALKDKLDGIQDEANAYSLPTATSDVLGGVKVGTGITITDGVIAIGQAVGTSNDVSFNSVSSSLTGNVTGNLTGDMTGNVTGDLTGNVTGNVTGEILSLDGTSILDNGTDGTDATFTGNSATATTLSSTLPINLGGTGSTIAPMIGIITAADESTARTQLNILSDTFTWLLSDNATQSKTVSVTGLTSTSIVTVTPNSNINPQTFYIEPNTGSFTIYSSGNLTNGTTFSYIAIIKNE